MSGPSKQISFFRGRTADVVQVSHGFTLPSFGFLPLTYDNTAGEYVLAQADDQETAADVIAVDFPDDDTITLATEGVLEFDGHGLTVGKWYILRASLAGLVIAQDAVTQMNKQYICYPIDADTLFVRIDPMFVPTTFVPQDIAILEDWSQGGSPTINTGEDTDRLLIVSVNWEDQSGSTLVSAMDVGGESGNIVVEQSVISGIQYGSSICYWTEAQLQAMTNNTITISWTSGAPTAFQVAHAVIQNVDQASPVNDTATDQGTGGTDTLDADVDSIAGGYVIANCGGGNTGMGFTNNGTGWTRKLNLTITSADGVVDDKLISSAATPENVNISITGSNRHSLLSAAFRRRES